MILGLPSMVCSAILSRRAGTAFQGGAVLVAMQASTKARERRGCIFIPSSARYPSQRARFDFAFAGTCRSNGVAQCLENRRLTNSV